MATRNSKHTSAGTDDKPGSKVYEMVTKQILRMMMKGEIPWRKTWTARGKKHPFTNFFTGKPYSFLNTMLLGEPGEFATLKQINDKGGHVRKGAKGKPVIYWGEFVPKDKKEEAKRLEEEGKDISHLKVRFPKYYHVFNVKDAEGLPAKAEDAVPETVAAEDPTDIAEMVIDDYRINEGVVIQSEDGLEPAYLPDTDTVTLPQKDSFTFEEDFYASLMEQLVHSTAAEGRCDRRKEMDKLREEDMSVKEELIAEIGASMILSAAGMGRKETHTQIAAVCQRWMTAMNNDYRLIVNASSGAEKAAKLILGRFAA